MTYDDIRNAIYETVRMDDFLNNQADRLANIVLFRLGKCHPETLRKLKAKLRKFNAHTGEFNG